MSENMLRGSLTSNTSSKGTLGFKGERGYSNYEIYVKNGGTMTEQEWLDHFGVDLTDYIKTSELIDLVYPVGSLYMSVNSTSPATLFGGTWERIKDTFLLSAGDTYTSGDTGGEATHTLTINEIPSHNHQGLTWYGDGTQPVTLNTGSYTGFALPYSSGTNQDSKNALHTNSTGGGLAHNNMPPYLVVYVWKRIQ